MPSPLRVRVRFRVRLARLFAFVLASSVAVAEAHDLALTHTVVVLGADGTVRVDVTCDLDAIALGLAQGVDSEWAVSELEKLSPEELERRIARVRAVLLASVVLRFDSEPASLDVSLPEYGSAEERPIPSLLGLTASFRGMVPRGARSVTVAVDKAFPPVSLMLMDEGGAQVIHQLLDRGAESDPFFLAQPVSPPGRLVTAARYFRFGFEHILPLGLDHVLFVLGLFLLSPRLKPLLFQVTAFTVAHTLTLALASFGVVRLPPGVVEPLIALSIAYVAVENLFTKELTRFRPLVVFAFGLLHGLGFAGVLGEMGLPREAFVVALLGFNAGVEAGQLTVIAGAFLAIGWLGRKSWYRHAITMPLSLAIAAVGLYWALERLTLLR